jgi:hypothetical protein
LGVAYALHKPLEILNIADLEFNRDDMIDRIVESWPYTFELGKILQLHLEFLTND